MTLTRYIYFVDHVQSTGTRRSTGATIGGMSSTSRASCRCASYGRQVRRARALRLGLRGRLCRDRVSPAGDLRKQLMAKFESEDAFDYDDTSRG